MTTERKVIFVNPTIDTAVYAAGDQLGGMMTLTGALSSMRTGILESVTIIDKSKQKSALSLLFFSALPLFVNADNGPLDISDAELAAKCLGYYPIAAADYKDLANASVATVSAPSLVISRSGDELYGILLSGGTPTYTSNSDLVLKLGIRVG